MVRALKFYSKISLGKTNIYVQQRSINDCVTGNNI